MSAYRPTPRVEVLMLAALLVVVGTSIAARRAMQSDIPLLPGAQQPVWIVGAELRFDPIEESPGGVPYTDRGVKVSIALPPAQHGGVKILEEWHVAPGYGFQTLQADGGRRAVWTRRRVEGQQTLFYNLLVAQANQTMAMPAGTIAPDFPKPVLNRGERAAADSLLAEARSRSADRRSLVRELLLRLDPDANDAAGLLLRNSGVTDAAVTLLRWAEIPARQAGLLKLAAEPRVRALQPAVDVLVDGTWRVFDPRTGREGFEQPHLVWQRGGQSLLDLTNAEGGQVAFSVVEHQQPLSVVRRTAAANGTRQHGLLSLFRLPLHEQNVFKQLLVIPIAALAVVLMRNVIGIVTSGTFMPVLLALAFLDTRLIPGIAMFLVIIAVGVAVRFYLTHLNLLLVARIAAALIVVIFLMMLLSLVSWEVGFLAGLKVSLFPLVIIAWTIERLAVTTEEEGGWAALEETLGTLMASVACYFVMDNAVVEHLAFNFPELNLVVLGATLLVGTYTGYRASELLRFKHMPKPGDR